MGDGRVAEFVGGDGRLDASHFAEVPNGIRLASNHDRRSDLSRYRQGRLAEQIE